MTESIGAFYSLWHGVPPEMSEDFELAHTREHLMDHLRYLGPNGNLWARRYGNGKGTLPSYFALYGMPSLDCLGSPANAERRVTLSERFAPIRAAYRDRTGHHCRVLGTAGGGIGGCLGTLVFDMPAAELAANRAQDFAGSLVARPAITAAHCGIVDWTVPPAIGLPLPTREPGSPERGVLVIEGFDRMRLSADLQFIGKSLVRDGLAVAVVGWAHYELKFAISYGDSTALTRYEWQMAGAGPA